MNKKYLFPHEAAEQLGVSPKTIARWSRDGKINFVRPGGSHRRFTQEEVDRLKVQAGIEVENKRNFVDQEIAEDEDVIRAKWIMDGAPTLSQAAHQLQRFAAHLTQLELEGWQLTQPVEDDYGFIKKSKS